MVLVFFDNPDYMIWTMDTDNDEDYIVLKKSFHHHHDLISNVKQVDTKLTPSGTF